MGNREMGRGMTEKFQRSIGKVQQTPPSIDLIKQLDIYKFNPWDLPKMGRIGEKEWYFYCPRDRKYRNSNRPNRVTTAGFWKATGTDRPIYSSDGTNCIGLKKSLVFYKGRASKGIKTEWMMHEFRLPSCNTPNDSWALCRIFKRSTVAQRGPHHLWTPSMVDRPFESSCNNNYSYTNIMDIPQSEEGTSTTNSTPYHITPAVDHHCTHDLCKSNSCPLPTSSTSLPNLVLSNTSDHFHFGDTDTSVVKPSLSFMGHTMLQMPTIDALQTYCQPEDSNSNDNTDAYMYYQQLQSEGFFNNSILGSTSPPENINATSFLSFGSNLYDAVMSKNPSPWDIPLSALI
ncbi:hypothetical protein SUGI_0605970 [Cryptomeria japonica]|nr:hypothetical protein SUGI_0605970 [Cryptomeria japonica]